LPPSPTPVMISIAIVSSIAILLLDTYRGRNFRYRPTLRIEPGRCQCAAGMATRHRLVTVLSPIEPCRIFKLSRNGGIIINF